ncbi:Do family serine endopeptidase [Devosia rhodophyticola]|uniref:Do family serine endopeptidase n=1 Tax=Devosia rhodophyticola TaxID=3026423 RepID=A0ABY7YX29_9HYPH|nr:Do family serine endopeptidase [Devosia rhodophyticola]WDR05945.1 Do family serine endopeptidase [Devosia rhodophyticola]
MTFRRFSLAAIALLVLAGLGYFATTLSNQNQNKAIAQAAATPPPAIALPDPVERSVPQTTAQVKLSFAPVVKMAAPSVVNVYSTRIEQQSVSPFANDPFFQRFFGQRGQFQTRPRESQSLGSGVIVDGRGIILTNSHVVDGGTEVRISLSDGREFAVDVVLDDKKTDLAVLKIRDPKGQTFSALKFANSDALQVGDLVLAIGNPFGVGQTVTSGIVSALARTGVESSDYEFFIQTDAAINPGNSGGALVDLDGNLVGINTAIFSKSGGSVGIGFAIPANMVRVVANAGISGGKIVRPWFGAKLQAVTTDIATSMGMSAPHGALITDLAPDGPAERDGFAVGDAILAVDGIAIDDPSAFNFRLATRQVGKTATLSRLRNGKAEDVTITVEPAPSDSASVASVSGDSRFAGTSVAAITPALAEEKGLPYDASGVIVTAIKSGSPAEQMGLAVDDIIISLNDQKFIDANAFLKLASQRTRTWQIVLQRGGRTIRTIVAG